MKALAFESMVVLLEEHRGGEDGGPAVHLLVQLPGKPPRRRTRRFEQIWRADLFAVGPHEHFFGLEEEVSRDLTREESKRLADWCIGRLHNVRRIIQEAGYHPQLVKQLDQAALTKELPKLRRMLRQALAALSIP